MKKYCFIFGTGRSGTYSIFKSLEETNGIKVYHESNFDVLLWLGTLKFHRKVDKSFIVARLHEYKHDIDSSLSEGERFVDISNALPLIIPELKEVFKNSTFVWVSRHAYKVVSSFYFKFQDLMYPEDGMQNLEYFLTSNLTVDKLIPDKRICRPLYSFKNDSYRRLRNICYHWTNYESLALDYSDLFDLKLKFEDMASSREEIERFFSMLNIPISKVNLKYFEVPTNVEIPKNFVLDKEEFVIYNEICGSLNNLIGYNKEGYNTEY
jgi:hypothetical protein